MGSCALGSPDCSIAVDVIVGDVCIGDVSVSLRCGIWSLLVFEADSSWAACPCCCCGSGEGNAFCMLGSFAVLPTEVGDPLGLLFIVTVSLATATPFLGFALPLLALSLLLSLLFLLLRLPLLFLLHLLRVLAEFVTNVLMREVALLRPHVIVGDTAEPECQNTKTVVVKTINGHD
jgi:hypothetical protein